MDPFSIAAILGNPVLRKVALGATVAVALVSAVFGFGAYERHVGKAEVRAEYERAAQAETNRETAVAEKAQQMIRQLATELAQTRSSRNAIASKARTDARSRLGNAGCVDPLSVQQLDRVR